MSAWESSIGATDEWYTPRYIFDALGETFDLDVASPPVRRHVPCKLWLTEDDDGLKYSPYWPDGAFIWMNPPFGGRNGLVPWLAAFFKWGNGIALTPDRTSAPWWQEANRRADAALFIAGKVRFIRPDGSEGKSPGNGTTLFAAGDRACAALMRAQVAGLGVMMKVAA